MHLTILYVEDSQYIADAVKETLESEGWRVETCVDGYVALLLIKSARRYDLILLDNELPNVNGLELARRVVRPHDNCVIEDFHGRHYRIGLISFVSHSWFARARSTY